MTEKAQKYNDLTITADRRPAYNSTYPKVAVLWLNQSLCFYQSLCLTESEMLRNRHLRVAANRWWQYEPNSRKKL